MGSRMSLSLIPKPGFVLVKPIEPPRPSAGDIVLADYYEEPETSGEVIALGGRFTCQACGASRDTEVAVGEVVLFPGSAGDAVEWQGTRYLLIPESDIIACVDEVSV